MKKWQRFLSLFLCIGFLCGLAGLPIQADASAAAAAVGAGFALTNYEIASIVAVFIGSCGLITHIDEISEAAKEVLSSLSENVKAFLKEQFEATPSRIKVIQEFLHEIKLEVVGNPFVSRILYGKEAVAWSDVTFVESGTELYVPSQAELANPQYLTAEQILRNDVTSALSEGNALTRIGNNLLSNIASGISTGFTAFTNGLTDVKNTLGARIGDCRTWLGNIHATLSTRLNDAIDWLRDIHSTLSLRIQDLYNRAGDINSNIGFYANQVIDRLSKKLENLFKGEAVAPEGSDVMNDLSETEDSLMQQIQDGLNSGLDYLEDSTNLLKQFAPAFLAVIALFDSFASIPFFSGLLTISLGISVFAIILNIGIDVNRYEAVSARRAIAEERYQQRQMWADERMLMSRVRFNNHMEKHIAWRQRQMRRS